MGRQFLEEVRRADRQRTRRARRQAERAPTRAQARINALRDGLLPTHEATDAELAQAGLRRLGRGR